MYMGGTVHVTSSGECTVLNDTNHQGPKLIVTDEIEELPWDPKVYSAMSKSHVVHAQIFKAPDGEFFEDTSDATRPQQIIVTTYKHENEIDNTERHILRLSIPRLAYIVRLGLLHEGQYAFLLVHYCDEDRHVEAVLFHVESACEIGRLSFPLFDKGVVPEIISSPCCVGRVNSFVAAASERNGVVVAGYGVRDAALDKSMRTMKKREKGKRRQHGKKKDGFQRGSSLFG